MMTSDQLQTLLSRHLQGDTLTLPGAALGSLPVQNVLETCLGGQPLVIHGAWLDTSDTGVTVTGTGGSPLFPRMPVTASFTVQDGQAALQLEATAPSAWTLTDSFPALANTLCASLKLSGTTRLSLRSHALSESQPPGLSCEGAIQMTGALSHLRWLLGGADTLPLSGPITFQSGIPLLRLTAPAADPVEFGYFEAPVRFELCSTAIVPEAKGKKPYAHAQILLTAELSFQAKGQQVTLPIKASFLPKPLMLGFMLDLNDVVDVALDELSALMDGTALGNILPEELELGETLSLSDLVVDLDLSTRKLVGVTVGVRSARLWTVVADVLEVKDLGLRFTLIDPPGKKQLALGLFGNVVVGGGEMFVHAAAPDFSFGGSLAKGSQIDLRQMAEHFFGSLPDVPELAITDLDFSLQPRVGAYSGSATTESDWTFDVGGVPFGLQRVFFAIDRPGTGTMTAQLGGGFSIGDTRVGVSATVGSTLSFTGQIDRIRLSTLAEHLLDGAALPEELPDLEFTDVSVTVSPKTGELALHGKCTARWDLPFGVSDLAVTTVELDLRRGPATQAAPRPLSCKLKLSGTGPVTIVDGLAFNSFALNFSLVDRTSWSLSGSVAAKVFEVDVKLAASLEQTATLRKIGLSATLASSTPLLRLPGVGSLDVDSLSITIGKPVQPGGTTGSGVSLGAASPYTWDVTAAGALGVDGAFTLAGALQLFRREDSTGFSFRPRDVHVEVPLPVPEHSIKVFLGLGAISIVRAAAASSWGFEATLEVWFTGLPETFDKILPAKVIGRLQVDSAGARVGIVRLTDLVEFTVPDMKVGSARVDLGLMAFDASNFALNLGANLALTMDFGLGLPSGLNAIFGTKDNGTPASRFFNTYVTGVPTSVSRFRLGVSVTGGVTFMMITSPIGRGSVMQQGEGAWFQIDMGDFGAVRMRVPIFAYDGVRFMCRGGFQQVEGKPLQIPLTPLKLLLEACKLDAIAEALPSGIPLEELDLVDERGRLRIDDFLRKVEQLGGFTLPREMKDTLRFLESRFNVLPDRFKSYLRIDLPEQFEFRFILSSDGNACIKAWVEGDRPLKFLHSTMGPFGPRLRGTELRSVTFGSLFGGSLLLLELDAHVDDFDLATLALAAGLPLNELPLLPDTRMLSNRFIARNLFTIITYRGVIPIPVPVFFDELALEYLGLEGFEFQSRWSYPTPKVDMDAASKAFSELKRFFTEHDYLLDADTPPEGLELKLTVGANYLRLPEYLGGKVLGTKKGLPPIKVFESLAHLMNGLKTLSLNELIQAFPLDERVGSNQVRFGPLTLGAQWLVTTPDEFRRTSYRQLKASIQDVEPLLAVLPAVPTTGEESRGEEGLVLFLRGLAEFSGVAKLDTALGVAVSTSMGFNTGFQVKGNLTDLIGLELGGVVVINPKGSKPVAAPAGTSAAFQLAGHSRLSVLGHSAFQGDIQIADERFGFRGMLDLFPAGSPLKARGQLEGWMDKTRFSFSGDVSTSLAGLILASAKCVLSNERVSLSGGWLGQEATLDVRKEGSGLLVQGRVEVDIPGLSVDLPSITKTVRGQTVKLADAGRVELDVAAKLAVTASDKGFSAQVEARFKLWGEKLSVSFHLDVAPADLEALGEEIRKRIIDASLGSFERLYGDAARWIRGITSGAITWASGAYADTGQALQYAYGQTASTASTLLRGTKMGATEVSQILAQGYKLGSEDTARALRTAGYQAVEVGQAIYDTVSRSADQGAQLLKAAGFGAQGGADALKGVFHASVDKTGKHLERLWNKKAKDIDSILRKAGYKGSEVEKFMEDTYDWVKDAAGKLGDPDTWNPSKW